MDYNHGTNYGYDQLQTNPLSNTFDNPYLEVPRILDDQQYASSAVRKHDIIPAPVNAGHYANYSPIARKSRVPLDTYQIATKGDEGMSNMNIDKDGMMYIFMFILILIVVINSITIKHLTREVGYLQYVVASKTAGK
jgi:hypothetical protein